MATMVDASRVVVLNSGTLALSICNDVSIDDLCDFASRANPKRGFLIVSKILGRHIPARPSEMRGSMKRLGSLLPSDLPEPIAFLGMAETATALGQGVFAEYRQNHPDKVAAYLQTSRQRVPGSTILTTFEEGHSHATSHLVQIMDAEIRELVHKARTLVIIDDECSTGNTFIGGAEAMLSAMPNVEQIETCCLTDWSGQAYCNDMPLPTRAHSLLSGKMQWTADPAKIAPHLSASSNASGNAPSTGMNSRAGLRDPEAAIRPAINVEPGERILVLGDGEHSYEALLIAEEIESKGGIAAVQCITRTPALLGHAMQSVARFDDAYGSGAPCFLYNMLGHNPDRILIASEIEGNQRDQAISFLAEMNSKTPVGMILCEYHTNENHANREE